MEDNPYAVLKEQWDKASQAAARPQWRTGVVMSASPLAVDMGGLLLTGGALSINSELLPRTRPVSFSGPGSLTGLSGSLAGTDEKGDTTLAVSSGEMAGDGSFTGTLAEQSGALAPGDRVVLLTQDDQSFIVLCKAVAV